ncbi:PREDICTED: thymidylate kinase isoform X2 [Nanorana parkeri]|uniref:thymidylate kinase isoform X2 n=1 Tax=Nanorana parkeri TaxID=125878 RepID=UPI000854FEE2|nr:PREDICTED: thymidylate kinase isoform X2 [Nanorana parkeri]
MAGRRGALIVLEGADRAGKSTQAKRLVESLKERGYQAEGMRFPERTTEIGRLVGSYLEKKSNLEDHTVHLLFSANRWEQVPLMKEKLRSGVTLVVDRYAFSGVAFTSSKKVIAEAAAKRGDFGNERYETSAFQKMVQKRYAELMEDRSLNWQVIDAAQSMEEVHSAIRQLSEDIIQEAKDQPLGKLWVESDT